LTHVRRNPEERRRRIIEAACELIPEVGVAGLTHRLVAARAGVPLGATTYYFRSLDELVEAALAAAAEVTTACLREWGEALAASRDVTATLVRLVADYLQDHVRMRTWNELYAAGGLRPELRPLARRWSDGLTELLAEHVDTTAARAAAVFIDGALLHALIHDRPIDGETLGRSLAAILGTRPA
jgi:DNA-binding transcriptional regulator YbjK